MEYASKCYEIYSTLKSMYDTMNDNWEDSRVLFQRCQIFEQILLEKDAEYRSKLNLETDTIAESRQNRTAEQNAFILLSKTFLEAAVFVKKYRRGNTYKVQFIRFIWGESYAKELASLNSALTQAAQDLNLAQQIQSSDRMNDIEAALKTIASSIELVLKQNMNREDLTSAEIMEEISGCTADVAVQMNTYCKQMGYKPLSSQEHQKITQRIQNIQNDIFRDFGKTLKNIEQKQDEMISLLQDQTARRDIEEKRKKQLNSLTLRNEDVFFKSSDLLGKGGFGTVYRGTYSNFTCAVKVINRKKDINGKAYSAEQEEKNYRKIQNELLLCQLIDKHPCILTNYGFYETRESVYIVMQLGRCALDQLLESRQWKSSRAVSEQNMLKLAWMYDMISGIEFLHSKRIKHRDIKPANALVCDKFLLKLCDFGLAKDENACQSASSTGVVGTHTYAAPEMYFGRYKAQYSSDVYSWAISSIHILAEKPPKLVPGDQEIRRKLILDQVKKLSSTVNKDDVDQLRNLLQKCAAYKEDMHPNTYRPPAMYVWQTLHQIIHEAGDPRKGENFNDSMKALSLEEIVALKSTQKDQGESRAPEKTGELTSMATTATLTSNSFSNTPKSMNCAKPNHLKASTDRTREFEDREAVQDIDDESDEVTQKLKRFLRASQGKVTAYEVLHISRKKADIKTIKDNFDKQLLTFCCGYFSESVYDRIALNLLLGAYELLKNENSRRAYNDLLKIGNEQDIDDDDEMNDGEYVHDAPLADDHKAFQRQMSQIIFNMEHYVKDIYAHNLSKGNTSIKYEKFLLNHVDIENTFPSLSKNLQKKIDDAMKICRNSFPDSVKEFETSPNPRKQFTKEKFDEEVPGDDLAERAQIDKNIEEKSENDDNDETDDEEQQNPSQNKFYTLEVFLQSLRSDWMIWLLDAILTTFGKRVDGIPMMESMNYFGYALYSSRSLIWHKVLNIVLILPVVTHPIAIFPEFMAIVISVIIFLTRFHECTKDSFFNPPTPVARVVAIISEFICFLVTLGLADDAKVNDSISGLLFIVGISNIWVCFVYFYFVFSENNLWGPTIEIIISFKVLLLSFISSSTSSSSSPPPPPPPPQSTSKYQDMKQELAKDISEYLRLDPRIWPPLSKALLESSSNLTNTNVTNPNHSSIFDTTYFDIAERNNILLELSFRQDAIFFSLEVRIILIFSIFFIVLAFPLSLLYEFYLFLSFYICKTNHNDVTSNKIYSSSSLQTLRFERKRLFHESYEMLQEILINGLKLFLRLKIYCKTRIWPSFMNCFHFFFPEKIHLGKKKRFSWQEDHTNDTNILIRHNDHFSDYRMSGNNHYQRDEDKKKEKAITLEKFHIFIRLQLLNARLASVLRRRYLKIELLKRQKKYFHPFVVIFQYLSNTYVQWKDFLEKSIFYRWGIRFIQFLIWIWKRVEKFFSLDDGNEDEMNQDEILFVSNSSSNQKPRNRFSLNRLSALNTRISTFLSKQPHQQQQQQKEKSPKRQQSFKVAPLPVTVAVEMQKKTFHEYNKVEEELIQDDRYPETNHDENDDGGDDDDNEYDVEDSKILSMFDELEDLESNSQSMIMN